VVKPLYFFFDGTLALFLSQDGKTRA